MRCEQRIKPKIDQDAACIRRELDAGPGFLEPFGLFKDDDAEALGCERQCGGQTSDASARDNDGSRYGNASTRFPKFVESCGNLGRELRKQLDTSNP